ncbi:hypothetical protein NL108_017296 [Boleophthalmus pectinirostris]|nr:hypothetical protein NL108_017296 [Boleophthalmus pectinirostris]
MEGDMQRVAGREREREGREKERGGGKKEKKEGQTERERNAEGQNKESDRERERGRGRREEEKQFKPEVRKKHTLEPVQNMFFLFLLWNRQTLELHGGKGHYISQSRGCIRGQIWLK